MEQSAIGSGSLLRLIGVMGLGVGVAWALQILGLSVEGSAFDRLLWVLAAAGVCGASFGLVIVAKALDNEAPDRDHVLS